MNPFCRHEDDPDLSICTTRTMETLRTLLTPDGATLSYRLWRTGTAPRRLVVLLHGLASNMTRWSEFVEHTTLKDSWDILRLDLRGHGESFSRTPVSLKQWSDDLLAIIDSEGYEDAVLIGHSLGAQVAMQFAHRHAPRVSGLVLIDPIFHNALRGSMRTIRIMKPVIGLTVGGIRLLNFLGLRRRNIPKRDLRRLDEETRATLLSAGRHTEMVQRYSSMWEDLKFFSTATFLQELLEVTRPLPPVSQLKAPVLALLSKEVTYTDPDVTQKNLGELSQAQTVMLDAYHWPLTEKPVDVREAIEQWCRRHFPNS